MATPLPRRALVAAVCLALVGALLVPSVADPAPATAQTGLGQVLTDKVAYGGNEVIRASGDVTFLQGCKERTPVNLGVDDLFQPWADLYIVPTGSVSAGGALVDISGAPNVIFGGLGGGFVEEVIGSTAPGGTIPAGTYDIVLDECQDGFLDADDALMSEAFRVVVPLDTEPAVIPGPDKGRADSLANQYVGLSLAWEVLLQAISKRKVAGVSLAVASDMSIAIVQGAVIADGGNPLPDPRPAAAAALLQMGRRQAGIAADPPDPAFHEHAALDAGTPIGTGIHGDPLEDALLASARSQAVDGALLGALVTAVERHQGAAEVGNGDWMAAHARDALELLDLIEQRAAVTPTLFSQVGAEYLAQIWDIRPHAGQLLERPERYLHGGDPHQDRRSGRNRGLTDEQIDAGMAALAPLENAATVFASPGASGIGILANLDAIGDELEAQALGYGDLRASLEDAIDGLAVEGRDAPRPVASAGGPYAGTVGEETPLDASASTGPAAITDYAWDLDLDGDYDDATGPTPALVPDQAGQRVVAVEVTDADGATDVAFAVVDVAVGDLAPEITSAVPDPAVVEGAPGDPFDLSVTVEDPEAAPVSVTWREAGVEVGTGTSFSGTLPAEPGSVLYEAWATDPAGNLTTQTFLVTAFGPDGDGDLWRTPGDCDDADPLVNPGRPEVTANGKDDDCDPETADDPQAPVVHSFRIDGNQGPVPGWQEGDRIVMRANWNHPNRYTGEEFTWTVDWHDGTTSEGTVAGTSHAATEIVAEHVYRRSGRQAATLCITAPSALTGCRTQQDVGNGWPALPAPPVVHPANLDDWVVHDVGRPGAYANTGGSTWFIAPGGFSGIQESNRNFPTVLISDYELEPGPDGSARFAIELGTVGLDDDTIGLTVGLEPGESESDDADWLSVSLTGQPPGTASAVGCGGSGGDVKWTAEHPHSLTRVRGYPHYHEFGTILKVEDATDPLCNDDMGAELLDSADMPAPLGNPHHGHWKPLVHPADYTFPDTQIDHLYQAVVEVSPEEITVWVDGVELLHATAPPDDPFPMGPVGLLSASQPDTRLIGHTQVPVVGVVQGSSEVLSFPFADADLEGSHTAVIEWGDGTPASEATIEPVPGKAGFWTASAEHGYVTVGQHRAEVCVTDTEDFLVGCGETLVVVEDAAPVVSAGPDRQTVGPVDLVGATVADPGPLDAFEATVDWGDGSPVAPVGVAAFGGNGVLSGDHTYAEPGTYTVEVCVESTPALGPDPLPGDEDPAVGCDEFEVEVVGPVTPEAYLAEGVAAVEGEAVGVALGFHGGGRGQTHTVSVDWGDGVVDDDVAIVDRGEAGFGVVSHTWVDDGTYPVAVTICVDDPESDDELCDTASAVVEVANAPPVIDEPVSLTDAGGTHTLAATFVDVGLDDTHTATVDWDEGAGPVAAVVTPDPGGGGGSVTADHEFAEVGAFTVEVCVTDDDGGIDCAQGEVALAEVPGAPADVAAVGGDGEARVSWLPPADDGGSPLTGYEVEVTPGAAVVATGSTEPETVVGGLTNGADHTFRVRALNAVGAGPWSDPSNVARPRASCTEAPFTDVGVDHPFCPEITWMAEEGVSLGFDDGTYRPANFTLRQAMAAFLYRLAGAPDGPNPTCVAAPFADVAADHPFCAEITWMVREGVTEGFPDNTFRPAAPVTRQAMAAFFQRYAGAADDPSWACTAPPFTDVAADDPFCAAIRWMRLSGMTAGFDDGTFRPGDQITRQAMAAMVQRYFILTGATP